MLPAPAIYFSELPAPGFLNFFHNVAFCKQIAYTMNTDGSNRNRQRHSAMGAFLVFNYLIFVFDFLESRSFFRRSLSICFILLFGEEPFSPHGENGCR